MTTTVVKSIGSGGDYTNIQAWEDACPANLVTADQIWRGECKNQLFTAGATISGATADATRYIELTTEAGASFVDNANVRTNALRCNSANGAMLQLSTAYVALLTVNVNYTKVSKLQIKHTGAPGIAMASTYTPDADFDQLLIESYGAHAPVAMYNAGPLRNSSIIGFGSGKVGLRGGSKCYNTTILYPNGVTDGIEGQYSAAVLRNVYIGGATTTYSGTAPTVTTCFTSQATPPSGWSLAAMSTANFESVTPASMDARLKSGSALIDVGTTDSTYAAYDVSGTARTGTWDVGAWEDVAAGGGTDYSLTASSIIASTATVGSPTLSQKHTLSASSISTASAVVASPAITQRHALSASAVSASPAVVGAPSIMQKHALSATAITAAPAVVGLPTLTEIVAGTLSALPIVAAPAVVGAPTIGQKHALSAGAISAGPATFCTPTISQQHALIAQGITAAPAVVGSPVLSEGGAVIFTSAPNGGGYSRAGENYTRPPQTNTVRH